MFRLTGKGMAWRNQRTMSEVNWTEVVLGVTTVFATVAASLVSYFTFRKSQDTELEKLRSSQKHEFERDRHERRMRAIESVADTVSKIVSINSSYAATVVNLQEARNRNNYERKKYHEANLEAVKTDMITQCARLTQAQAQLQLIGQPDVAKRAEDLLRYLVIFKEFLEEHETRAQEFESLLGGHFKKVAEISDGIYKSLQPLYSGK